MILYALVAAAGYRLLLTVLERIASTFDGTDVTPYAARTVSLIRASPRRAFSRRGRARCSFVNSALNVRPLCVGQWFNPPHKTLHMPAEAMTRDAIGSLLREAVVGTLSLTDGGDTYAVPQSFGYDGETVYFQLVSHEESRSVRRDDGDGDTDGHCRGSMAERCRPGTAEASPRHGQTASSERYRGKRDGSNVERQLGHPSRGTHNRLLPARPRESGGATVRGRSGHRSRRRVRSRSRSRRPMADSI